VDRRVNEGFKKAQFFARKGTARNYQGTCG
jgi:hypothetical protein